jgi:hypothetical protein
VADGPDEVHRNAIARVELAKYAWRGAGRTSMAMRARLK